MFDFSLSDQDLTTVNFHKKITQCISNQDLKQMIIDHLFQNYNIRMNCTNKYFRVFDQESDLPTLKKYKHLAYINTNHNINLIVLAKFLNQPVCLYIDKLIGSIYLLKCQFSPSLYEGSIFEGELIETFEDNYFMISDFLVYKKKNLSSIYLDHRLKLLKSIFTTNNYKPDPILEPFKIILKDFVEYSQLESYMNEYISTTPYKDFVSGLIFRPLTNNSNKNLIYNFNKEIRSLRQFHVKPAIEAKRFTSSLISQNFPDGKLNELIHKKNFPNVNLNIMNENKSQKTKTIDLNKPEKQIQAFNSNVLEKTVPPLNLISEKQMKTFDLNRLEKPIEPFDSILEKTIQPFDSISEKIIQPYDSISSGNFQINTDKYKIVKFMLFETGNPDDYILKLKNSNNQLFHYGYALLNDMKTSQYFQKLLDKLSSQEKKNGICVKCKYHPIFKKWKPIEDIIGDCPTNISELQ